MFGILTNCSNRFVSLLQNIAERLNIECKVYNLLDEGLSITISNEEVWFNKQKVAPADRFWSLTRPEFPIVPAPELEGNCRNFSDDYAALQQQKSQIYSVLTVLGRKGLLLNEFERQCKFFSKVDTLYMLMQTGIDMAGFCVTNKMSCIEKSPLAGLEEWYWSCVEHQAPLKVIRKNELEQLLSSDTIQPYIFYRIEKGIAGRVWILNGKPILAALVTAPGFSNGSLHLEKYEYITDPDFFESSALQVYSRCGLDFFELHGIVKFGDQKFAAYGLDPYPVFPELEKSGAEWLAARVISSLCNVPLTVPKPQNGTRGTVYLDRMLEPLIETAGKA
ncbi:MAG: hypothetical protein GX556_16810 [Fibrobacter sp.]|nr:hypothetical protein [Fibrobacter sp.]